MMSQFNDNVAITRYDGTIRAIKKGIELIKGLEDLRPSDNILIKPNILWGAGGTKKIPKYGFVTTSRLVEGIVIVLREKGCKKISIGEGCIANDELGSNTLKGFAWSGLERVARKHDVRLIDFNNDSYIKVKGCPPKVVDSMITMIKNTLEKKRARKILTIRLIKGLLNKLGIYNEHFHREFAYELPEFDPEHF